MNPPPDQKLLALLPGAWFHTPSLIRPLILIMSARAQRRQLLGMNSSILHWRFFLRINFSSTDVAGIAGLVSATGNPSSIGFAGTSGGLGSGPGPSATGAPILPSGTNPLGLSGTGTPFTGAASNHLDNLSAGLLAIAGLALIL